MKKKVIILTGLLGVFGFSAMFALAWFTRPKPSAGTPQANALSNQTAADAGDLQKVTLELAAGPDSPTRLTMTDRQLQTLIYEVREKINDYNLKLRELGVREERMQTAQETLKKDIREMEQLRVELAASAAALKTEQQRLAQSRLEIDKVEQENLVSIAATYDKMDADSAGIILMNMVKNQGPGNSSDDAVKILYYMTERTKAKVLASMAEAEPAVSAYLCQKLKRMMTKE